MSLDTAESCGESGLESSENRTCHRCDYMLIGLPEPATCPECGSRELPRNVWVRGLRAARWWRVAFLGPFVKFAAGESVWRIALNPRLGRASKNRIAVITATFVCAVLAAASLSGWWVYEIPDRPGEAGYRQRGWWAEAHRANMPSSVSYDRSSAEARIAYHYALCAPSQNTLVCVEKATEQVFYFVFRMFGRPWMFLVVGWPLLCAILHGIELRRGFRMVGILASSFGPFLLFVPVLFVAKLGYMLFLIDWRLIQYLFLIHLAMALWPGLTYARYAMLAGSSRWCRYACVSLTCLVVVIWPIVQSLGFLLTEEYAMGWV